MGLLNEEMQRRLEEWRKATQKEVAPPKPKPPKAKNFVSRRDYGDDIEFMRSKDDNR